ncbi:hypothetical protein [Burkholderia gladioli]|uniref:Uncharacterized protein n=1 Tax=Burkholderia gladioli TaxID=28095 RepID=A0AB38U5Q8_BURGA|nr:hypothetical protein [Burkholderia gladioli]UWX75343.1 hypothetical protein NYZ96_35260 [Burkholderia gladioli]
MDQEVLNVFKRVEQAARALGVHREILRGSEVRAVQDSRGRLLWRINNRPTSRFDAIAYFA